MNQTRHRSRYAALALAALAATLSACDDDDDPTNVVPVATTIAINSGSNNLSGTAGQALSTPISVRVRDQDGDVMSGATVTWTVASGGGSVSAATSTTNATGDATVTWTLGATPGANTLTAAIANGQSVTITATGTAPAGG